METMTEVAETPVRSPMLQRRWARIAGQALTAVCGVVALISASGKLTEHPDVVELLDHVQVSGALRDLLPYLQIAGGLGALISLIRFPRLGVVALVCLTLYFVGAVGFHLRVGDGLGDFAVPLGYVIFMGATAALRAATLHRPSD